MAVVFCAATVAVSVGVALAGAVVAVRAVATLAALVGCAVGVT
jgi:hypothetical protein